MEKAVNIINSIIADAESLNDFNDIPLETITKIHVTIIDKTEHWLAQVIPSTFGDYLCFDLYIKSELLEKLLSSDDRTKQHAKSIIYHELYHVKEFILTCRVIDLMSIYEISKNSTRALLLNLGYKQWTEYYAHYNSSKYHLEPPKNMVEYIELVQSAIEVINGNIALYKEYQMPESIYNGINIFIGFIIRFTAIYNQTHDKSYVLSYLSIANNKECAKCKGYVDKILLYMDELYHAYPVWVSEEKFLEIGKTLFGIIHEYGITYSTLDLSDNFIFVSI